MNSTTCAVGTRLSSSFSSRFSNSFRKDGKSFATANGGGDNNVISLKPLGHKEGTLLLNASALTEAEKRIVTVIEAYFRLHGELPGCNYVRRLLKCRAGTVSSVLASIRRELDRVERQIAYVDKFINPKNKPNGKFETNERTTIDNGTFALLRAHPANCQLFTVVVPSNSEICFLGTCDLAQEIPAELVKRLLPKEAEPLYVFRWEIQRSKRLHLHILISLPNGPISISRLKCAWFKVLDDVLDERTHCAPFMSELGNDCRNAGDWVHVQEFKEKPEQEKHSWSYLATARKHGRVNIARRWLSILNGEMVMPRVHGDLSPALAQLCKDLSIHRSLPLKARDEGDFLIDKVIQSDIPANWQKLGSKAFTLGKQCRIAKDAFDSAYEYLQMFQGFYPENKLPEMAYRLVLRLSPNRTVKAYVVKNKRGTKT